MNMCGVQSILIVSKHGMLAWVGELIAVHTGSDCEVGQLLALLDTPWCQHLPGIYFRPRTST